jgi:hypothetical protein
MSDRPIFTYQTRFSLSPEDKAVLDAYGDLYGRAERSLFVAMQAGDTINDLKKSFLPRFGITARHFNALRVGLAGKIDSIKTRRTGLIAEAESRIRKAEKVIARREKKAAGSNKLHQKKRRLANLKGRLAAQKEDHKNKTVRICFGSKRLFHAQFDLDANNYASHAGWKQDWHQARSNQLAARMRPPAAKVALQRSLMRAP